MPAKTQQLIEAHLQFILKNHTPRLHSRPVSTLIAFEDLLQFMQTLDLTDHIHKVLVHPATEFTQIEQIIDVMTVDQLAQYISSKTEFRQKLIQQIVYSPIFANLVSQIINRALQDYLNNPLLKAGKSVLEQTLQKKLGKISENLLNQYLTDDKLYHLQADLWHKIKNIKITQLVDQKEIEPTLLISKSFWVYFSQSSFFKTLLQDWYSQANIRLDFLEPALTDEFIQHTRQQLENFYYLPSTQTLL